MLDDLKQDAQERMAKTVEALSHQLAKIRTGRATPAILDAIKVDYYGSDTPIAQVAQIKVEDARTLAVTPWEKNLVPAIEKAIMTSDLGLNPASAGDVIRVPMPPLTEETRKGYVKQAKAEAEQSRISVRNIRRDVLADVKSLLKDKEITEDDERRSGDEIQKDLEKTIGADAINDLNLSEDVAAKVASQDDSDLDVGDVLEPSDDGDVSATAPLPDPDDDDVMPIASAEPAPTKDGEDKA